MMLVSGACGTGKTILAMQFLYRGAKEFNEPGVFVTFDEMPDKLREDMLRFGWDVAELENKNKLAIVDATSAKASKPSNEKYSIPPGKTDVDYMFAEVLAAVEKTKAKRLAIDSIPAMAFQLDKPNETRGAILKLSYNIARSGLTAVITTETDERPLGSESMRFSRFGVEEYVADGVIVLSFLGVQKEANRTLYIRKMRGSTHATEINPMQITNKGIVVRKIEDVFK